jgi:acetolactate synthase I/II/III large subunit
VIVEIPADVGTQEVPEAALHYQPPKRFPQAPSATDVKEAVRLLLSAQKPLIWSGMGTLLAEASAELRELAELTEIPVYCTMPGKSGFDERHPLALGSGSSSTGLHARQWIQESDVLLALGSSLTRTSYGQPIPDGKVMIHNTESLEDINKDYAVAVGLPGDAKLTIQMLIEEVKAQLGENGRKGQSHVAAEIGEVKQKWLAEWTALLHSDEVPINTYRVIGELERTLDKERSIVTHDGAPQLHRLGQDDAPGLRHPPHDRHQARQARQVLPQLHGRRRLRHVRAGHRNLRARRGPHHHHRPE